MRLHRPLLPPRLHKPKPLQNPQTAPIPRIHIRDHALDPPLPKHAPGPQQRTQRFGHEPLFPIGAVEHEADFGLRIAPDARFADYFLSGTK